MSSKQFYLLLYIFCAAFVLYNIYIFFGLFKKKKKKVLIGPHYTNLLYITFQHIPQASSSTSVSPRYTYRVKIINPSRKKESVTRELRRYNGRFASVTEMKVRIVEQFDDYVPQTRRFSVGYFDPNLAATKRWICCDDDIAALYDSYKAYQGKEILLWCEGCSSKEEDNANCPTTKRRRKGSNSREDQESKVEELAAELQEMHEDNLQLSELHYRLWARMIMTGVYLKKDTPPQVPMITGVAPKRNRKSMDLSDERKSLQDSIVSTATAVVKALSSANQSSSSTFTQSPQIHQTVLGSPALAVSPGKVADIRGKSFVS